MQHLTRLMLPTIRQLAKQRGATIVAACRHPADKHGEGVVLRLGSGVEVWTADGHAIRSIHPRDWRRAEHTMIEDAE